jgi:hypothetical protein
MAAIPIKVDPDRFLLNRLDGNLGLTVSPGALDFSPFGFDSQRRGGGKRSAGNGAGALEKSKKLPLTIKD